MVDPIKNSTHVAYDPDLSCYWSFVVPSDARTFGDQRSEFQEKVLTVFDIFTEFSQPTVASIKSRSHNSGIDLWNGRPDSRDWQETKTASIKSTAKIDRSDVTAQIQTLTRVTGGVPLLRQGKLSGRFAIEFTETEYIGRDSDKYATWHDGELYEQEQGHDPVTVKVVFRRGEGSENAYSILVETHTDLWFEEHEMGRENRDTLQAFLEAIRNEFDVKKISHESNKEYDDIGLL